MTSEEVQVPNRNLKLQVFGDRRAMKAACWALGVIAYVATSAFDAEAVEMIPVCKEHYSKFVDWKSYYKVFAYGSGGGRAACAYRRGEQDAVDACTKTLDRPGIRCRVYARSPVNGKLEVVWDGKPKKYGVANKSLSNRSDKEICSTATSGNADAWEPRRGLYLKYVVEAEQRGLSLYDCKLALGYETKGTSSTNNLASNNKSDANWRKRVEEEQNRAAEAERRKRIDAERKRKLADAHRKMLAPLRKKH